MRAAQAVGPAVMRVVQAFRPAACTTPRMITARPRRLTGVSYVGFQRYFVTTCTAFRKRVFEDGHVASDIISRILESARQHEFSVVAYCVMPDHVHLLVVAQSESANLPRFVKHAKQVTGFAYRRANN